MQDKSSYGKIFIMCTPHTILVADKAFGKSEEKSFAKEIEEHEIDFKDVFQVSGIHND